MTDKLPLWERIYLGWWWIWADTLFEWRYLVTPTITSKYACDFWFSLTCDYVGILENAQTATYKLHTDKPQ